MKNIFAPISGLGVQPIVQPLGFQQAPQVGIQPPPDLTPAQKNSWNLFIDYIDKSGYKGNPMLDDRNKSLGQELFNKFKKANPKAEISYEDVPRVQQSLQDYRADLVNKYKKGLIAADPSIKSEADIMQNLSSVDGWVGSKTSSHKFPVAINTKSNNGVVTTQNYGTDMESFDKSRKSK